MKMQWVVQASSQSWSGGRDICMNLVRGKPAVFHTISRILEHFPQSCSQIRKIACPDLERRID